MFSLWKKASLRGALRSPLSKSVEYLKFRRFISRSRILHERGGRLSSKEIKKLLDDASNPEENSVPDSPDSVWLTTPYKRKRRDQASYGVRVSEDPSTKSIILFPGQGTQYVGMSKSAMALPVVKDMFMRASEILNFDLAKLCLEGPKKELDKTSKCQPAILVSSLAALEIMKERELKKVENCIATAGFSVGEFAALVFAGVLSFEDAVHLVKVRGEAMQEASELVRGGMMTVIMDAKSQLGIACHEAVQWCIDNGVERPVCAVANYLYPHCKVIAGHEEALSFVERGAKTYHLRRCKRLPVSGAFHTKLMKPAIEPFQRELNKIVLNPPVIPVHSNIDGKRYASLYHISHRLSKQIISPVKWEQTMHILTEYEKGSKLPSIYECGPGKSLSTLLKMVNMKTECNSYDV